MKYLSSLLFLVGLSSRLVHAYDECKGCNVILFEDDIAWGVENDDWCSKCKSFYIERDLLLIIDYVYVE